MFIVPSHEKNGDYYENPCLSHLINKTLILRKLVEKKLFIWNQRIKYLVSKWRENVYNAKSQKDWRLLQESKFVLFDRWTLILQKMVEMKAFPMKPKHQYHGPQWGEHIYGAQSQKRMGTIMRVHICLIWWMNFD